MSVIKKPDLKIFAQDAKAGEIESFPDILRGWGVTLERTAGKPPLEWFNAIGKRVDEWLMYLTQRGVAEWDVSLSYPKTAIVQFNSIVYVSVKETKGEQPDKSQASWSTLGLFLGLDKYSTTAAMNLELNKKFDKANISGVKGNDNDKAPSLNLFTTETGKLATKADLTSGLNTKLNTDDVTQSTGASKEKVMSQDAATKSFQPKGSYLEVGAFGFGGNAINVPASTGYDGITQTSVLKGSGVSGTPPGDIAWGSILHLQRDVGRATQLGFWQGNIATRSQKDGVWEEKWSFSYTEANTEKDSQGFLKEKGNKKTVVITDNIAHTAGDDKTKVMSQWGAKDCFMQFGDFGLGGNARSLANLYPNGDFTPSMFDSLKTGFYSFGGERNAPIPNNYNHFIYVRWNDNAAAVLGFTAEGHAYLYGRNGTWRERIDIYTSKTAPKNTASKSSNSGWWKCANTGLIYQFASGSSSKTGDLIQFPIAFPSACIALNISDDNGSNAVGVTGRNTSGFNIRYSQESKAYSYIAVGY
ncbi:hypothetical protein [Providencia huaxiensis]|uniref:gp53-like domain-containing protein n=1 Tax=Providencia huaxiensis TaxID=2027290 RepID=UPI0033339A62